MRTKFVRFKIGFIDDIRLHAQIIDVKCDETENCRKFLNSLHRQSSVDSNLLRFDGVLLNGDGIGVEWFDDFLIGKIFNSP
jgi:hypothetical protein